MALANVISAAAARVATMLTVCTEITSIKSKLGL
jgi:hypothetical protein